MSILPAPGIYKGVPSPEYQDWPALRTSHLKAALRSWYHFRRAETVPSEDTDSLILGRATHCAAFEPSEYAKEFWCPPKVDGRTSEGKAAKAEYAKDPRVQLTAEDSADIAAMVTALRNHADAGKILALPGDSEVSMVWNDVRSGLTCKGRIDRLITRKSGMVIVDLKTAADASPNGFARSAIGYGYDIQAAQYVDGLRACTGIDEIGFVWLVVEKKTNAVAVYSATDAQSQPDFLTNGRHRRDRLMRGLVECRKSGNYPGYTDRIEPLRVPAYSIEPEVSNDN